MKTFFIALLILCLLSVFEEFKQSEKGSGLNWFYSFLVAFLAMVLATLISE